MKSERLSWGAVGLGFEHLSVGQRRRQEGVGGMAAKTTRQRVKGCTGFQALVRDARVGACDPQQQCDSA